MLNIAILGPGKISHRFMNGMKDVYGARVVAVASRDLNSARDYACKYNIEKYYSYDDLYNDSSIDAVYIATPPFVHKNQIIECLLSNKHVLCEKPLMKSSKDAKDCFELALNNNLVLMEANKTCFTPTFNQVREWIKSIGNISYIEASYCYKGDFDHNHWVYDSDLAGGGMYDVGVYPLMAVYNLADSKVCDVVKMEQDYLKCKGFSQYLLKFENGIIASVRGAITTQTENKLMIYGDLGYIECPNFWKSKTCKLVVDGKETIKQFDFNSEFTFEIQHFVDCINKNLKESPIMSSSASIDILKIIEK